MDISVSQYYCFCPVFLLYDGIWHTAAAHIAYHFTKGKCTFSKNSDTNVRFNGCKHLLRGLVKY